MIDGIQVSPLAGNRVTLVAAAAAPPSTVGTVSAPTMAPLQGSQPAPVSLMSQIQAMIPVPLHDAVIAYGMPVGLVIGGAAVVYAYVKRKGKGGKKKVRY